MLVHSLPRKPRQPVSNGWVLKAESTSQLRALASRSFPKGLRERNLQPGMQQDEWIGRRGHSPGLLMSIVTALYMWSNACHVQGRVS